MSKDEAMKLALEALEIGKRYARTLMMNQEPFDAAINAMAEQPAQRKPLTAREIELIDGMIKVQLDHAARCDNIPNRVMAEKQKGWDMERVELLRKLKENT